MGNYRSGRGTIAEELKRAELLQKSRTWLLRIINSDRAQLAKMDLTIRDKTQIARDIYIKSLPTKLDTPPVENHNHYHFDLSKYGMNDKAVEKYAEDIIKNRGTLSVTQE